jgi:regulator of sigma E protease
MTVIIAVLGLILLIVIHEMGHMLTAKALGVRVTEFGVGFGPALFKKQFGKTIYSFRIILLGGFAKMAGMNDDATGPDTYTSKPAWRRALIIFAGPFANILAAVVILAGIFMFSGQVTGVKNEVRAVEPGTLAAESGVKSGDKLVSVDGKEFSSWKGFKNAIAGKKPGDEVTVGLQRNGETKEISGALSANPDQPKQALVGVQPVVEREYYGFFAAIGKAVSECVRFTGAIATGVAQLVTGQLDFYDNVTGPVGIASVGGTAVQAGFFPLLLALISLNLALMNLLPILPLDGGHLFFIAAEKVIGRPVSAETMGKVAAFGLALVLMLFVFALYADVSKLVTGQSFLPQ